MIKVLNFIKNTTGNLTIVTALTVSALGIASGSAVDYYRVVNVKGKIQNTADAAILVATDSLKNGSSRPKAKKDGENYFLSNIPATHDYTNFTSVITFDPDPTTLKAKIVVSGDVPTTLMNLAGITKVPLEVSAATNVTVPRDEITLVLDISQSMRGRRLRALKVAAKDFIDALKPFETTSSHRIISIVPFANRVNWGLDYSNWVAPAVRGISFEGCLETLPNFENTADEVPVSRFTGLASPDGQYFPYKNGFTKSGRPTCPTARSEVSLFHNNPSTLKRKIDALDTAFGTGTDVALEAGWRTLAPKWRPHFKGLKKFPEDNLPGRNKILILLTDGRIFRQNWRPGHRKLKLDRTAINEFDTLCNKLDADNNIKVFTVGFDLNGASLSFQDALRKCASNGGSYHNPDSTNLRQTFENIAKDLTDLRLSS